MKIQDIPRSGSVNAETSSRNRFGQYVRRRAVPVNPASGRQLLARASTQEFAAAWRALTDAQRAAWTSLGSQMQRTDSLGQVYTLTGLQAFTSVNNTLRISGQPTVTDPPPLTTPDPLASITVTLSTSAFSVAFTPTPLGAQEWIQIWASPQRSAGRQFENDFRLVFAGALASASPANILAAYSARFGSPQAGNRIFIRAYRCALGFSSQPITTSAVVAP
jgi:hypothetical protein